MRPTLPRPAATARRSAWLPAAVVTTLGAGLLLGPALPTAGAATAVRLTTAQVRTLSNKLTVGVSASGTTASRESAAAAAAAPLASAQTAADPSTSSDSGASTGTAAAANTLTETNEVETATGLSLTGSIPGSASWYRVDTSGQVALVDPSGQPSWTRTEQSFLTDWGVQASVSYLPVPTQLSMLAGYDPVSAGTQVSDNTFAVGDLGGRSGGHDIAVAYSIDLSGAFPFTLPDSALTNEATFVTVLDGNDGRTLWHQVYPGVVTQLVAADGGLLVGNETGPDWEVNPVAEQGDSRSNLSLLTFRAHGNGVTQTTAWTYGRDVPWARWTSVISTPYGIAAGWTDTPEGLGDPRPADGHVILLDPATGRLIHDTPTAGYPRILIDDSAHGRIVAAEETDPTDEVSWQLTAFSPKSGARSVLATENSVLPTTLTEGDTSAGPAYLVSTVAIDADGDPTSSTAQGLDASGNVQWSTAVPTEFSGDAPVVGGLVLAPQHHGTVLLTSQDPQPSTETNPDGPDDTQIMALNASTGAITWDRQGAVGTGLVPALDGDTLLSVAADDTAYGYRISTGALKTVQPLLGDAYTGVQADVNGKGAADLIVGGQSRGVFALDGTPTTDGVPHYLWTATVQGSVHQIQSVDGGREVLVAATGGWDLIDVRSGRVLTSVDIDGAFTWSATAVDTAKGLEVIVPTHTLTAYAASGKPLWTYTPSGDTVKFSDAALDAHGDVIAEYSTGYGDAAPQAAAVSVSVATGKVQWTVTPSATVRGAESVNAVYASKAIPLDHGDAVAFAWPATFDTLVELRDAKTGALLTSTTDGGFITHTGFSAAPGEGLIQSHWAQLTRLAADGTTWSSTDTYPMNYEGSFATSGDGSSVYLTANDGIQAYDQSEISAATDGDYAEEFSATPAIDDSQQLVIDGSQALGFQQDSVLWNLDWAWIGGGFSSPDSAIHGVTVNQIGTAPATKGTGAPQRGSGKKYTAPRGLKLGDPISGTGWGDGSEHSDAVVTPADEQSGPDFGGSTSIPGYIPSQVEHELGLSGTGAGQTVVIVDAYDHPLIESELNTFSKQFGLTQTCDSVAAGTACVHFTVQQMPDMQPQSDNWDLETALDVEWVHAVAPQASIVLVEAASSEAADLYRAVDAAAALNPAAVSMSWGESGEFSGQDFYNGSCELSTTVCVEAAGDDGNPAGYGATAPDVLSIGGTSEQLDTTGNLLSQSAWSDTGGGLSFFEARPAYQDGFNSSAYRGAPDVSALADPETGVAVYYQYSSTGGEWTEVGGTSLATPIWASILAATDQDRAAAGKAHLDSADGSVFAAVYGLGDHLLDVTSGSNGACPAAECTAHIGYDTVTGLGSPGPAVDAALAAAE